MRNVARTLAPALLLVAGGCSEATPRMDVGAVRERLVARIAESGAATVGLYFRNLGTGDSVLLDADVRVHAASTMKVPVMIQLYRDQEAGLLRLDDRVTITKTFRSIVDGSPYDLDVSDDSDSALYGRVGERETIRALMENMITVSGNLATNILIDLVGAERTQTTMRELGADSIAVLRGVEDIKAYQAGLSNTTTARDLGIIMGAVAEGHAASGASCREMVDVLARQAFNDGIPAGLPAGTRVAHKTGWITGISHDAAVVYPDGAPPYVLVILTRGVADSAEANRLIADLSRIVYDAVVPR